MKSEKYIDQYEEIRPIGLRAVLRHGTLSALAEFYTVLDQSRSSLERNRIHFLSFHHVLPDEEQAFRGLLEVLHRHHTFISYSEAVDKILKGNVDKPYITFSFDDGFKNCLRAGQIMSEVGAKACFFVIGSMVGESDYQVIKAFCSQRLHLPPVEFLSWDEVETLLRQGHEIGCHTMSHPNLSQISSQQVQDEIGQSFELLKNRLDKVKHFAWPYGKFSHFTPAAAKIVFQTGFESCASAERGCHIAKSERLRLCVRRDHIIAAWPISHILYFIKRSSHEASAQSNIWPPEWAQVIANKREV